MPAPLFDRRELQPAEGWPQASHGCPTPLSAWLEAMLEDCDRNPRVVTRFLEDGPYLRPRVAGLGASGAVDQPNAERRVLSPWELAWIRR